MSKFIKSFVLIAFSALINAANAVENGGVTNIAKGVVVDTLIGNFSGNAVTKFGGAVYNEGIIKNVTGNFFGNYAGAGGGAIYNSGNVGILAKDRSVEFSGNHRLGMLFWGIHNVGSDLADSVINMNSYGVNRVVVNDSIVGALDAHTQIININNGLAGDSSKIDASGKSFGAVEFNNQVMNQTVNVAGGTLKLGSYTGGVISLETGGSVTTQNSIAKLVNSDVSVSGEAKLLIGADVNGSSSVSFDANSGLTLENGGTLAFEEGALLDFDGIFSAENATLLLELSDYVAGLDDGEVVKLDWTIATFVDSKAAADALAGFSNFANDLGIAKGDESSKGSWFNVTQVGSELKVTGVIPEPATIGLIGLFGGALLAVRRRWCA